MSVKFVERYAVPAWSPVSESKSYIALGSCGSNGALEHSPAAELEIFAIDSSSNGDIMSAICHHRVESPFRSIAWSNLGPSYTHGIIAGGHVDGKISLWDASKLLSRSNASSSPSRNLNPTLFAQDLHNSQPVLCMEFNPQKPSLLGSGGADGCVQVVNIERPSTPDIFRGVTTNKHLNSEVVCLSWNRKVQHIMASASNQGLAVVWDLKNKKEVVTIKDPGNRTRCSALSWNPEIPTQLLIAYNDDQNPCVQLWDMRNCSYPFREFQEHSRGVTAASFCDLDGGFVVSSGRDNRSVCWSLHSGSIEAYSDLNLNAPATKLEWSSQLPGFIAASSATGTVSIHSISQRQTPAAARNPPKWIRQPCGVSFGFGGKLVTFGSKQGPAVSLHIVPDEPTVVGEADRFEEFLARDLRPFCEIKSQETHDDHDRLTWKLLSILHEGPESRKNLLAALGVDQSEIQSLAEKYLGRQAVATAPQQPPKGAADNSFDNMGHFGDAASLDADQLDNIFDQLARNSEQQQLVPSAPNSRRGTPRGASIDADDPVSMVDWSQGPEAIIKQSILIGDLASAVECCLKCGRFADALFLAAGGDAELWKRTRSEYARKQKDPFIRLVGHILSNDLEKFVAQSDLSNWVESLAILVTYASGEDYTRLVEQLASRLEKERFDVRSAVLCYLCCGSFANTVRLWASMSNVQGSQSQSLQGLVEKMSCLFNAVRPGSVDSIFTHKMHQYAGLLANSGRIVAAMRCLILVPDSMEARILKERIYNAAPGMMGQLLRQAPQFPFDVADVRPAAIAGGYGSQAPQTGFQQMGQPPARPTFGNQPPAHAQPQIPTHAPQAPMAPVGPQSNIRPPMSHPGVQPATSFAPSIPAHQPPVFPSGPSRSVTPGPIQPGGVSPSARVTANPYAPSVTPKPVSTIPPRAGVPASHPAPMMQPPVTPVPSGWSTGMAPPSGPGPMHQAPPSQGSSPSSRMNTMMPSPIPSQIPQQPTGPAPGGWNQPVVSALPPHQVAPPQRMMPQASRPVGPPTSSGVSTAPHATANPVTPGMPVSWPIPTPVQQQLSPGVVPPPKAAPLAPVLGEPVPPQEVATIQRTLTSLLERCAQDGNRRKWDDTANKLNELYRMLGQGLISRESVMKVKDLCRSIDMGDFATASRLRVELSTTDWEKNRTWLFAIQLLLPK